MTLSRKEPEDRILLLLNERLGFQDAPQVARRMATQLFLSAVTAEKENRVGRPWEAEKNVTEQKLAKLSKLLEGALKAMSDLNPLAKERVGRERAGLLALSSGDLDAIFGQAQSWAVFAGVEEGL